MKNAVTREQIQAHLIQAYQEEKSDTGLFSTDVGYVVMDRVDGEFTFAWFDEMEKIGMPVVEDTKSIHAIGERFAAERRKIGKTQQQVAEHLGMGWRNLALGEKGMVTSLYERIAMVQTLGMDVEFILTGIPTALAAKDEKIKISDLPKSKIESFNFTSESGFIESYPETNRKSLPLPCEVAVIRALYDEERGWLFTGVSVDENLTAYLGEFGNKNDQHVVFTEYELSDHFAMTDMLRKLANLVGVGRTSDGYSFRPDAEGNWTDGDMTWDSLDHFLEQGTPMIDATDKVAV